MPLIKCMECDRMISYPGPTTSLFGVTETTIAVAKPGTTEHAVEEFDDKNFRQYILTLECSATPPHRHNYIIYAKKQ